MDEGMNEDMNEGMDNVDLTEAQEEVSILNTILNCMDYHLMFDYISNFPSGIVLEEGYSRTDHIFLCLYKTEINTCVGNIGFEKNGNAVYISSHTLPEYENRKINKLLRAVSIIIAGKLKDSDGTPINMIYSEAVNEISAYLMLKYFNAKAFSLLNRKEYNVEMPITRESVSMLYRKLPIWLKKVGLFVALTEENIENAKAVFREVADVFACEKKSSVSSGRTRTNSSSGRSRSRSRSRRRSRTTRARRTARKRYTRK
jgi:hypothetical protein